MGVTLFWIYLIPAVMALIFKSGLFFYAYKYRSQRWITRVYVFLLCAFSVQNLAIISGYPALARGAIPSFQADLFYAATTFAVALILHLAVVMATEQRSLFMRMLVRAVYVCAFTLTVLILNTSLIVNGYEIANGYVITRIAGPYYGLFALYAITSLLFSIGLFVYGAFSRSTPQKKLRNQFLLLATIPMQLTVIAVLVLFHFGVKSINVSILSPVLLTYFLAITAYATHQHRLFDLQFYIPWSKVRKRKTAFYGRIRATIAEIADLSSVKEGVSRLADALNCAVVLVDGPQPIAAGAEKLPRITQFPVPELRNVDKIVIANEIVDAQPQMHALMKQHGVAAIVPFYPHSETVASWMLLGDTFSDNVYTPLDFKMVEELFDRMGELFLDKLVLLRTQLREAREEVQLLQVKLDSTEKKLVELRENTSPQRAPARLMKSGDAADVPPSVPLDDQLSAFESRIIEETLKQCGGNKSQAARMLGLRPNTLHYKIERYRLADKKTRE